MSSHFAQLYNKGVLECARANWVSSMLLLSSLAVFRLVCDSMSACGPMYCLLLLSGHAEESQADQKFDNLLT